MNIKLNENSFAKPNPQKVEFMKKRTTAYLFIYFITLQFVRIPQSFHSGYLPVRIKGSDY